MLTTCIRPSGIFGECDGTSKAFVESAVKGKLRWQVGDGENLFDWTFNENVTHAHFLAARELLKVYGEKGRPVSGDDDMRVAGQGFIITNDEHISFWKFARRIGNAAGYVTREEDVRSMPKVVGIAMAVVAEWVTWILSFGRSRSRMNRVGIKFSCMTRTFRIDKAKRVLGYRPLVSLSEGIERSGRSWKGREKDV